MGLLQGLLGRLMGLLLRSRQLRIPRLECDLRSVGVLQSLAHHARVQLGRLGFLRGRRLHLYANLPLRARAGVQRRRFHRDFRLQSFRFRSQRLEKSRRGSDLGRGRQRLSSIIGGDFGRAFRHCRTHCRRDQRRGASN